MNFFTKTLSLVGQSFLLFIKKPWLLLYGIIPSFLVQYISLSQLKNIVSVEQQEQLPQTIPLLKLPFLPFQLDFLLFKALFLIGVTAFIYHIVHKLNPTDSSLKKTRSFTISAIIGLIVLLLIEFGIAWFNIQSISMLKEAPSTTHIILRNMLLFIWATTYYFLVSIIVTEQTSLRRAVTLFWRLLKDCWAHIIFGTIIIGVVIVLIQLMCALLAMTESHYPFAIPALFGGLSLIKYTFAVLLYRWHTHHYAITKQNEKR